MNVFSGELFCFCGNNLLGFFVERDKEEGFFVERDKEEGFFVERDKEEGFFVERDKEEIYHGMFISFSCAGDVFSGGLSGSGTIVSSFFFDRKKKSLMVSIRIF
jgi:hypothetical protein